MQILIIAATELEIQSFKANNSQIDILVTGVGVPAAIYHLQKRVHQIDYDLIIQAGIAGSFNTGIPLGSTVMVKQDCFADLGIEEKEHFTPLFNTVLADKDEFPFNNGWLVNADDNLKYSAMPVVNAITVNKVGDHIKQSQHFIHAFNADIESMEGAALHFVCLMEAIPFLQVRAVSNYVGERDKTKWKMKEAIENLNAELETIINSITD